MDHILLRLSWPITKAHSWSLCDMWSLWSDSILGCVYMLSIRWRRIIDCFIETPISVKMTTNCICLWVLLVYIWFTFGWMIIQQFTTCYSCRLSGFKKLSICLFKAHKKQYLGMKRGAETFMLWLGQSNLLYIIQLMYELGELRL